MLETKTQERSFVDLWSAYAKEYLGETNFLTHDKICVNYNQWFESVDYRRELAARLQLEFSDAGIDFVSHRGGESSFDKRQFDHHASQMDVTNRWQAYANDETYRQLLNNEELLFYSKKIFGNMVEIENLIASAK